MKWHFDDFIYGSIDGAVTTFAIIAIGAILYIILRRRKDFMNSD